MFDFTRELYYRGVSYYNRLLFQRIKAKKGGSTLPVVPRQSERIKIPGLSSCNDLFCFFIGASITAYENDHALSDILDHCIRMAQRYKFTGKWKIWEDYINYFDISHDCEYIKNINVVDTAFDIPSIFEFLSLHYTEDEIFGNVLTRAVNLITTYYKVVNRYSVSTARVNYPQRKRGYNDKGSLAPFDSRARREANTIIIDTRDNRRFDVMSEIQLWGPPDEDPD